MRRLQPTRTLHLKAKACNRDITFQVPKSKQTGAFKLLYVSTAFIAPHRDAVQDGEAQRTPDDQLHNLPARRRGFVGPEKRLEVARVAL
jgi:hypothetical protein